MAQLSYRDKIYPKYTSQKMTDYVHFSDEDYRRWGRTTLKYITGWLPQDKKSQCLDVACGAGYMLHLLKSSGYVNISGIDISPEQIAASKKISSEVYEANAIAYLQQHKDSYDLITGFDIIEHFTKDEVFEFLDGLYEALRPGGVAILQTLNADSPFGMTYRYGDLTHELAFTTQSITHLFNITKFVNIESIECGPVIHGLISFIRYSIWKIIRFGIQLWNLVETGHMGSGVYTRIFLVCAKKP